MVTRIKVEQTTILRYIIHEWGSLGAGTPELAVLIFKEYFNIAASHSAANILSKD